MNRKLLCALLAMGSAISAQAQIPTTITNRFQTVMDSLITNVHTDTGETLGVSVAITIPGYGSWQGASGQANTEIPLNTNMTMGIASCGKLYTTVILLKLQENGILSLDDTIDKWIPGPLPNVDKTATIRQLLKHQTDIFDIVNQDEATFWDNVFLDLNHFWTYPETLTMIQSPNFGKGTAFAYSNTGYAILAYIIENATNKSLAYNLHQYITQPLGLTMTFDSATDTTALNSVQESASYTADTWWPRLGSLAAASMVRGMGSLVATPKDVVAFYQALFNTSFLSSASMNQLLDFDPASSYGPGIQRWNSSGSGTEVLGHSGSFIGFRSEVKYDPKTGAFYFIVVNSDQATKDYIPILTKIYKDYFPKKTNDAGISQIISPRSITCEQMVQAQVILKNFGSNTLTAVNL